MSYATVQDVEDRLGRPLDAGETTIVQTRLNDVELIIRNRIPDLDRKVAEGSLALELVVMVEAEAVLRLVRNPEGYTAETDGNYSYQINARVASGAIDILPSEWALLGVKAGAFVIRPYIGPYPTRCGPPWPWESTGGWFG